MPSVYVETSIIGYLTSRSRNDVIFQARQELTRLWWDRRRGQYEIVVSQLVLDEAGAGDEEAAAKRLELLDEFPLLDAIDPRIDPIVDGLLAAHLLPEKPSTSPQQQCIV